MKTDFIASNTIHFIFSFSYWTYGPSYLMTRRHKRVFSDRYYFKRYSYFGKSYWFLFYLILRNSLNIFWPRLYLRPFLIICRFPVSNFFYTLDRPQTEKKIIIAKSEIMIFFQIINFWQKWNISSQKVLSLSACAIQWLRGNDSMFYVQ